MARDSLTRLNWVKNDISSVSRAEPRKIVSSDSQINSWGILETIPDCPECGTKHSLVVKAKVVRNEELASKKGGTPAIEQRICCVCGHQSNKAQKQRPLPPTEDQIAYANRMIIQRYYELKSRYVKSKGAVAIPEKLKSEWKSKGRKLALDYLREVTNGFPVDTLYSQSKS